MSATKITLTLLGAAGLLWFVTTKKSELEGEATTQLAAREVAKHQALHPPPKTEDIPLHFEPKIIKHSRWTSNTDTDAMRGISTVIFKNESINKTQFAWPRNKPSYLLLTIQKHSNKKPRDVLIRIIEGQFLCHPNDCTIAVKFDDGKVMNFSGRETADYRYDILFIDQPEVFMKQLKKAQKLTIEAGLDRKSVV